MIKNLFYIFFLITTPLVGSEYKITPSGTEKVCEEFLSHAFFHKYGINDNGQIYSQVQTKNPSNNYLCIIDSKDSISFIDKKIAGGSLDTCGIGSILNNNNQLVYHRNWHEAFIWNLESDLQQLNIFDHDAVFVKDINDCGQIIGKSKKNYNSDTNEFQPFLWDNGISINMGINTPFAENFLTAGFTPIDIELYSINNKGEIAGIFSYGKYNKNKKTFVKEGVKVFFWDGKTHVLPLDILDSNRCLTILLNNNSSIMISSLISNSALTTYLWNVDQGIQTIYNFHGYSLNDSNTIIGEFYDKLNNPIPTMWKNDSFTSVADLLNENDLLNLNSPYSDSLEVEQLKDIKHINNKGQMLGLGLIWGEWHPCIIEPVEFSDNTQDEIISHSFNNLKYENTSVNLNVHRITNTKDPINREKYNQIKQECLSAADFERLYWKHRNKDQLFINRSISNTIKSILNTYRPNYSQEVHLLYNEFVKIHLIIHN